MGTVVGLFETRNQAQRAIEALKDAGYSRDDISIVMRDRREAAEMAEDVGAGDATAAGVIGGGLLGGLAGWLVGIGALAIPGIGPIVAAGPLAAALTGGAIGAATGGLLGALADAGVPEEEARVYQTGVERGGILVTVNTPAGRENEARSILQRNGMRDVNYHRNLHDNPDYEYDVERADDHGADKTIGGSLAGGAAGAAIGTAAAGPAGTVAGAVIGGTLGAATGATMDFAESESEFRREYESSAYRDRYSWDQARPAYQYGWESYERPDYQNREWDQVRGDLQRNWRGQGNWNEYEPMVRSGWDRRSSMRQTGMRSSDRGTTRR